MEEAFEELSLPKSLEMNTWLASNTLLMASHFTRAWSKGSKMPHIGWTHQGLPPQPILCPYTRQIMAMNWRRDPKVRCCRIFFH